MPAVSHLIGAHIHGDPESLKALGVALAAALDDVPEPPTDPAEVWAAAETRLAPAPGTWQEVVAARDDGRLTEAELDYLTAAVDALEDS